MIYESAPWKNSLARDAVILERWAKKPKITGRRSFLIERTIFLAAYSIRKLSEAGKLSSSFNGITVMCYVFPLRDGKKIDRFSAHQFFKLYDLGMTARQTISAPNLLDLLIHSLLFSEAINEDETISGFFVTSDYYCSNVWLISIDSFIELMRRVSSDFPTQGHWVRSSETGEYIEWRGNSDPPVEVRSKMDRFLQSKLKPR